MAFVNPDDGSWLLAVANLSADDAQDAELDLSGLGKGEWQVERLSKNGRWQTAAAWDKPRLRLDVRAFSVAVWRCSVLKT